MGNKLRVLVVFLVFLSLSGCNKEKFLAKSNSPGSIKPELIQNGDNADDVVIQDQSTTQFATSIINSHSRLELESVSLTTLDRDVWYIGREIDEQFISGKNTVIATDIFGIAFGPIDGFENEQLRIGWNNRNRVLYLEVLSNEVKTFDGIGLGDSKEKILETLGDPFIEDDNQFRYQNTDFEVVGILFQFVDGIVTKIFLFGYV